MQLKMPIVSWAILRGFHRIKYWCVWPYHDFLTTPVGSRPKTIIEIHRRNSRFRHLLMTLLTIFLVRKHLHRYISPCTFTVGRWSCISRCSPFTLIESLLELRHHGNASGQIDSKFGVRELQMNLSNYVHRHHALNVKKCTHVVGYGYVRSRLRSSQHSITRYFLTVRSKKYYTRNQSFNNHSIYDLICNLFYGHRQISHFGDSCLFHSYLMLPMLFQTTSAKFDRFFQHSSYRNSKTSFS